MKYFLLFAFLLVFSVQLVNADTEVRQERVAVFLLNYLDSLEPERSRDYIQQILTNEVEPFFEQSSYGTTDWEFDIYGWKTLPYTVVSGENSCRWPVPFDQTSGGVTTEGDLVHFPEVNFSEYRRALFIYNINCAQIGPSVGGPEYEVFIGGESYRFAVASLPVQSLFVRSIEHELGHSLDAQHGDYIECRTSTIDESCWDLGYGDHYDIMGNGRQFNSYVRNYFGWLPNESIANLSKPGRFTVMLSPLQSTQGIRSITIPARRFIQGPDSAVEVNGAYFVEYFTPLAEETTQPGILLRWVSYDKTPTILPPASYFYLIDASPKYYGPTNPEELWSLTDEQSNLYVADWEDSALTLASPEFLDPAGINIILEDLNALKATVKITLGTVDATVEPIVIGAAEPGEEATIIRGQKIEKKSLFKRFTTWLGSLFS